MSSYTIDEIQSWVSKHFENGEVPQDFKIQKLIDKIKDKIKNENLQNFEIIIAPDLPAIRRPNNFGSKREKQEAALDYFATLPEPPITEILEGILYNKIHLQFHIAEDFTSEILKKLQPTTAPLFENTTDRNMLAALSKMVMASPKTNDEIIIELNMPKAEGHKWTTQEFHDANPNLLEKLKSDVQVSAAHFYWPTLTPKGIKNLTTSKREKWLTGNANFSINTSKKNILNAISSDKNAVEASAIYQEYQKMANGKKIDQEHLKKIVLEDLNGFKSEIIELLKKEESALKMAGQGKAGDSHKYDALTEYALQIKALELRVKDYQENVLPKKVRVAEQQLLFSEKMKQFVEDESSQKVKIGFLLSIDDGYSQLSELGKAQIKKEYEALEQAYMAVLKFINDKKSKEDLTLKEEMEIYEDQTVQELTGKLNDAYKSYFSKYLGLVGHEQTIEKMNENFSRKLRELSDKHQEEKNKVAQAKVTEGTTDPESVALIQSTMQKITELIDKNKKLNEELQNKKKIFDEKFQERFKDIPEFSEEVNKRYDAIFDKILILKFELEELNEGSVNLKKYYHPEFIKERKEEILLGVEKLQTDLDNLIINQQNLETDLLRYGIIQENSKRNSHFKIFSLEDTAEWPKNKDEMIKIFEALKREKEIIKKELEPMSSIYPDKVKELSAELDNHEKSYDYGITWLAPFAVISRDLMTLHNGFVKAIVDYQTFKENLKFDPVQVYSFKINKTEDYELALDSLKKRGVNTKDLELDNSTSKNLFMLDEVNKFIEIQKKPTLDVQFKLHYPFDPSDKEALNKAQALNKQNIAQINVAIEGAIMHVSQGDQKALKEYLNKTILESKEKIVNLDKKKEEFRENINRIIKKAFPGISEGDLKSISQDLMRDVDRRILYDSVDQLDQKFKTLEKMNFDSTYLKNLFTSFFDIKSAEKRFANLDKHPEKYNLDESSIIKSAEQILRILRNKQFDSMLDKLNNNYTRKEAFVKAELSFWLKKYPERIKENAELIKKNEQLFREIEQYSREPNLDERHIDAALVSLRNYYIAFDDLIKERSGKSLWNDEIARMNQKVSYINQAFDAGDKIFEPMKRYFDDNREKVKKIGDDIRSFNQKKEKYLNVLKSDQMVLKAGIDGKVQLILGDAALTEIIAKQFDSYSTAVGSVPKEEEISQVFQKFEELQKRARSAYLAQNIAELSEITNEFMREKQILDKFISDKKSEVTNGLSRIAPLISVTGTLTKEHAQTIKEECNKALQDAVDKIEQKKKQEAELKARDEERRKIEEQAQKVPAAVPTPTALEAGKGQTNSQRMEEVTRNLEQLKQGPEKMETPVGAATEKETKNEQEEAQNLEQLQNTMQANSEADTKRAAAAHSKTEVPTAVPATAKLSSVSNPSAASTTPKREMIYRYKEYKPVSGKETSTLIFAAQCDSLEHFQNIVEGIIDTMKHHVEDPNVGRENFDYFKKLGLPMDRSEIEKWREQAQVGQVRIELRDKAGNPRVPAETIVTSFNADHKSIQSAVTPNHDCVTAYLITQKAVALDESKVFTMENPCGGAQALGVYERAKALGYPEKALDNLLNETDKEEISRTPELAKRFEKLKVYSADELREAIKEAEQTAGRPRELMEDDLPPPKPPSDTSTVRFTAKQNR